MEIDWLIESGPGIQNRTYWKNKGELHINAKWWEQDEGKQKKTKYK